MYRRNHPRRLGKASFPSSRSIKSNFEYRFKTRVLCYLISHVLAWQDFESRLSILRCLSGVEGKLKMVTLQPLLEALDVKECGEYVRLVYDVSCVGLLNESESGYWKTMFSFVEGTFTTPGAFTDVC